jgi:hypothetical protein
MTVGALVQPALGDFAGFTATRTEVIGTEGTYRVVRVYANFTRADDRLLNIFDVQVSLSGSTSPTFLQASDEDYEAPPSFLPYPANIPGEAWDVDSFITIGAAQGDPSNGTVADPDFNDSGAASGAGVHAERRKEGQDEASGKRLHRRPSTGGDGGVTVVTVVTLGGVGGWLGGW